jgi:hypothetical protein
VGADAETYGPSCQSSPGCQCSKREGTSAVLSLHSAGASERQARVVSVRVRAREVEIKTLGQNDWIALANATSIQTACARLGRADVSGAANCDDVLAFDISLAGRPVRASGKATRGWVSTKPSAELA